MCVWDEPNAEGIQWSGIMLSFTIPYRNKSMSSDDLWAPLTNAEAHHGASPNTSATPMYLPRKEGTTTWQGERWFTSQAKGSGQRSIFPQWQQQTRILSKTAFGWFPSESKRVFFFFFGSPMGTLPVNHFLGENKLQNSNMGLKMNYWLMPLRDHQIVLL